MLASDYSELKEKTQVRAIPPADNSSPKIYRAFLLD